MKIAYICTDIGIPVFGHKGASAHIREIVNAFEKLGHETTIYSANLHGLTEYRQNYKAVEIHPDPGFKNILKELWKLDDLLGINNNLEYDLKLLHLNISFYEKLKPIFTREKFDFIYERYSLLGYSGIALSKHFSIPHILEINSPLVKEHTRMVGTEIKRIAIKLEQKIFKESDSLIVVSKHLKKYCTKLGIPEDKISVLPNGVDIKNFKSTKSKRTYLRRKLKIQEKNVLGFVGSLRPWHDLQLLLKAFDIVHKNNPDVHLLIVGDGPGKEKLIKKCKNIGISKNITWTGYIPHHQIPQYISVMDVCIAPYKPNSDFYFSPIKVFEYMALSKPVIAADIGQLSELISVHKTGMLYETGDLSQLTDSIQLLIDNLRLREIIGGNAYRWVKKNRTWDLNAKMIIKCANNIVKAASNI